MSPRLSASDLVLRAQTDARLASLAAAGHERAFALLVERHGELLSAIARRIVGAEDSEDVVQQGLLRAWRALRTQTEVRNVSAWLSQIVRNVALTEYARQRATPEALPPDLPDPRSVAGSVEKRFDVQEVIAGLAVLPDAQRAALLATEFEGRSRRQIATELGLSEGAVRQLVHRARSALRVVVTAVTPYPLIDWLGRRGAAGTAAAGSAIGGSTAFAGGSAVGGGAFVKGGAAILAVTAVAGGGLAVHAALRHVGHSATRHVRVVTQPVVDRDHGAVVAVAIAPRPWRVATPLKPLHRVAGASDARRPAARAHAPERYDTGGAAGGDSSDIRVAPPPPTPQATPSPVGGGEATTASSSADDTSSHTDDQYDSRPRQPVDEGSGAVASPPQPTPTTTSGGDE